MLLAKAKGYGFSSLVSSGNQAMLEVTDYLEYFGADEGTRAIILYIEGIPDANRFARVVREVVKKKPIMVYKAGRFEVGVRAALSHTASLAGNDKIFDALCKCSPSSESCGRGFRYPPHDLCPGLGHPYEPGLHRWGFNDDSLHV